MGWSGCERETKRPGQAFMHSVGASPDSASRCTFEFGAVYILVCRVKRVPQHVVRVPHAATTAANTRVSAIK